MPLGSLVVIQQHAQDLLDIVDKQLARIEAEALRRKAEEDNAIKTAAGDGPVLFPEAWQSKVLVNTLLFHACSTALI